MKIDRPTPAQIPQLRQLWQEAFGDTDAFLDSFFSAAFSPSRCLCATVGCAVAAAAYWFSCGEYAYIYAVATAKAFRGRGICHALMEKIHEILTKQGYAGCILVPGSAGLRQFYSGMGYRSFGGVQEFTCEAGTPLSITKIDPNEFAVLRRQYLPEGGVIQEAENLAFLSCLAEFYRGDDFLLTAALDGDTLHGMELLGNADAAAGIVAALGAKRGAFRKPGDTPFAMHLPLNEKKVPGYFGFAFD